MKSQFRKLKEQGEIDFKGFSIIAKDVDVQKKRIGGNFAVAHAVNNQEMRECIRQIVPDVIFITLTLTKETQRKRIKVNLMWGYFFLLTVLKIADFCTFQIQDRHGEQAEEVIKMLTSLFDIYEPPGENERNTYNVEITDEMTPNDVLEKVQKILTEIDLGPKKELVTLKDGYYQNAIFTPNLHKVDGNNITVHPVVSLDYPDLEPQGWYTMNGSLVDYLAQMI